MRIIIATTITICGSTAMFSSFIGNSKTIAQASCLPECPIASWKLKPSGLGRMPKFCGNASSQLLFFPKLHNG